MPEMGPVHKKVSGYVYGVAFEAGSADEGCPYETGLVAAPGLT
jgi:hypothetical protein